MFEANKVTVVRVTELPQAMFCFAPLCFRTRGESADSFLSEPKITQNNIEL